MQKFILERIADSSIMSADETVVYSFGWLGIGITREEMDRTKHTSYLDSIDIPPIPATV